MTRCESVARPWDRCDTCTHVRLEPIFDTRLELCAHRRVIEAFGRERVSAAMARAEVCDGQWHPRHPRTT